MWSTIREVRENCARIYHSWVGMFPSFTLAQTTDPSVGSWNFKVTVTGECTTNSKYIGIGVLSHNRLNERNRLLATVIWQIVADSAMLRLRTT